MPIKLPSFRPRKDAYPPDLWTKCPSCSEMLFNKQLDKADRVCPTCGHHFRLSAQARLDGLLDRDSFQELDAGLQSLDPLGFVDQKPYPDRIAAAQLATGLRDAAVRGIGLVEGRRVSVCVMDFGFMGGSMGAVVGEKVTRAAELALAERVPLIVVSASGGARMQEGTLALMQLAKTCAALERLRAAGVPYLSIMSDPTTGGVFASYAVLGDVNLAEPNALIGFAGARVTAGTIAQELPAGFQRAEFLYEHGFVDRVVHRRDLRHEVALLLRYLAPPRVAENGTAVEVRPTFDPIGFLSSLADKVVPDAALPPVAAPAPLAAEGPSTVPAESAAPAESVGPATPDADAGTAPKERAPAMEPAPEAESAPEPVSARHGREASDG
ncbi:MAG TPA: acetyl-CoA carboxylase, carboxyltransferase subunit beta [Candidatus Limnocylindrales bacterium]